MLILLLVVFILIFLSILGFSLISFVLNMVFSSSAHWII